MSADMLATARRYASRGLSIIPLLPHDKVPAIPSWTAYQQRIATDDELRLWYDEPSRLGAAIVTGAVSGNLAVIDCDDMATAAIVARVVPQTMTVKTGKGKHFYFRTNEPVNTTAWTMNGLRHHIKAEGGYVVAPPSIHPSGVAYGLVNDCEPAHIAAADLRAILASIGAKRGAAASERPRTEAGWTATLLQSKVPKGERHEQFARLAGYLSGKLYMDETCAVLRLWLEANVEGYQEMTEYRNTEAQVREWYRATP